MLFAGPVYSSYILTGPRQEVEIGILTYYNLIKSLFSTHELNDVGYQNHLTSDLSPRFLIIFQSYKLPGSSFAVLARKTYLDFRRYYNLFFYTCVGLCTKF